MTHVFIGLMVLYRITAEQAKATNRRRGDFQRTLETARFSEEFPGPGWLAHVGTMVAEGDRVPMIITQVHQDADLDYPVNGQAFLDGSDSLWVTMVAEGDAPGEFEPIMDG